MPGCKNNALLLHAANAGTGTTVGRAGALAHLHKHQRAVFVARDQINLTAAAAGCSIIALYQLKARLLQVSQRKRLSRVAALLTRRATV